MLTDYLQCDKVRVIPLGQRAIHTGGVKERTEHLRMLVLNDQINAGSPKLVGWLSPSTCKATEPLYYSTFACNGFSRLHVMQHRQGYKGMATTLESPAAWEEGR